MGIPGAAVVVGGGGLGVVGEVEALVGIKGVVAQVQIMEAPAVGGTLILLPEVAGIRVEVLVGWAGRIRADPLEKGFGTKAQSQEVLVEELGIAALQEVVTGGTKVEMQGVEQLAMLVGIAGRMWRGEQGMGGLACRLQVDGIPLKREAKVGSVDEVELETVVGIKVDEAEEVVIEGVGTKVEVDAGV